MQPQPANAEMPKLLALQIFGTPKPQGSMRAIVNKHTGKAAVMHNRKTIDYRSHVAAELAETWYGRQPHTGPILVAANFLFERPAAHYLPANSRRSTRQLRDDAPDWPTASNIPDCDKLQRLLGDALQIAGVIKDDAQIVGWLFPIKRYTDTRARSEIVVYDITAVKTFDLADTVLVK